ncbi:MAG: retroviral-like aspartic protease family protein [Acidobacteriota bacterium]|nr:retroviral-like aspartic protease family protein [Acidobacteriota bacterium]
MKKLACQILFVAINLLFLTFNLSAQTPDAPVKFRLVRDFLIIVPVQINDSETLEFLLDTGMNTSVIIPEVAARLKLRPVVRIEIVTVAGSTIVPSSFLPRLTLGGKSAANLEVLWSDLPDLPELRRLDKRISGVLGQNFLAQFNFTLNFRERRIDFADANENQFKQAARLPFETNKEHILLTLKTKQTNLKFVLDSGASDLILFASGCRKLEKQIERSEQLMQVSTIAGKSLTQTGWLDGLQFGNKSLSRLPVALLGEVERAEDGLLPMRLFSSVYFNNQEGYVFLNP